ncbi:hypothetical protein AMATHDRAFT_5391 [Amanita thiersii Skay4041]|uniref:Uncharacterized protein n=1 Tax=Amanita thiersii Skay4041 TaxID=703135 RepID=A0A2A9NMB9_9AGAR|nr:hypothetical protein AMATHDRAFT_5391 [Amanita thiersii Skay4041]
MPFITESPQRSAGTQQASEPMTTPRTFPSRSETMYGIVHQFREEAQANAGGQQIPHTMRTTLDEKLLYEGAEEFRDFEKKITELDKEFHNFANAARKLGSSVAVIVSTFKLRERLAQVLYLYRENAATLFPRYVPRRYRDDLIYSLHSNRSLKRSRMNSSSTIASSGQKSPTNGGGTVKKLKPEDLPNQLKGLATDFELFCDSLEVFPDLLDSAINETFDSFQTDLEYWASCLAEHLHHFHDTDVQRYIHGTSQMMKLHLDDVKVGFGVLTSTGVPTVQYVQRHSAANLLNLSTVATFFSAVTATTLQYSFQMHDDMIATATNAFWFASLVFSISAAVNSLLAITWKQAIYRSPGNQAPWWVVLWIERSPVVFLVCSITSFSLGLCCFAFSSHQELGTKILTAVLTGLTSSGLATVSAWVAFERWIFVNYSGKKLVSDVFAESRGQFFGGFDRIVSFVILLWARFRKRIAKARTRDSTCERTDGSIKETLDNAELGTIPHLAGNGTVLQMESPVHPHTTVSFTPRPSLPSVASPDSVATPTTGRQLWKTARIRIRSMVYYPMGMIHDNTSRSAHRRGTTNTMLYGPRRPTMGDDGRAIFYSRIADLATQLKELRVIGGVPCHHGPVHHLQFAPNGEYLATAGANGVVIHQLLPQKPHMDFQFDLLTLDPNGVRQTFVKRPQRITVTVWLPREDGILSVEDNYVAKINVEGQEIERYDLGEVEIHDIAVTPDGQYMIVAATVLETPDRIKPKKAHLEKRIIVYNLFLKAIESYTPVFDEVRRVMLTRQADNHHVLVSSENHAPQSWRLEKIKDKSNPKLGTSLVGHSYYGGSNDELVICASKTGEIQVWDQESGSTLHHLRPPSHATPLACVGWNRARDEFMFAIGSHDGDVQVWAKPQPEQEFYEASIVRSQSPDKILTEEPEGEEVQEGPVTPRVASPLHTL